MGGWHAVDDALYALATGPHTRVRHYESCIVGDVSYNTLARDEGRKTQNSAITTGNSYFAVCHGGRQRLERRTAKTFAISRGRQKAPAKKATVNSCFAVCFLAADGKGSLPSAADGKEGGRQYLRCQSVKWLTADLCRPPQTAKSLWSLPSAL